MEETTGGYPPTPHGFGADPHPPTLNGWARIAGFEVDPDDPLGLDDRHLGTPGEAVERSRARREWLDARTQDGGRVATALAELADALERVRLAADGLALAFELEREARRRRLHPANGLETSGNWDGGS